MSRQIDVSNITDEDRLYLSKRGHTVESYAAQQAARAALREAVKGTIQRRRQPRPLDQKVVIEEVDEPYDQWSTDELKTELRNRKLSVEGKKADLVERLEQDDDKNPA